MILHEFKRIKHGYQPGDLPKRAQIFIREKKGKSLTFSWGQHINLKQMKSFRNFFQHKSKKRQRRRNKEEIEIQMEIG